MQRNRFAHQYPFGAQVHADGTTEFRLWAPSVAAVQLDLEGQEPTPMTAEADGWFSIRVGCRAGARYRYRMPDGLAVPDPASRRQDGDVHGWSVVVDPLAHEWQNLNWVGRPWHEAVIYECHPGAMGGFAGISAKLEGLRDLGFTMIELMPIADFPGTRNWGYDGVLPFAPDEAYGTPGELKAMVDHAHGLGIGVMLDVVYNHFGPDGAYIHAFAREFFDEGKHSPWGAAIDFERAPVRDFFVHNAIYWLREYRFDGLRFDAVAAYQNDAFLSTMAQSIRAGVEHGRHVALTAEHENNMASILVPGGFDAQWTDDTHHSLHVLLTGEQEGYYEDFPNAAELLARCLREGFAYQGERSKHMDRPRGEPSGHLPTTAFVIFIQNHDQTGNRAMGERMTQLAHPEALAAATALLLLAPMIPLVFMGDEFGSHSPWLFFTDHHDELAELVRQGRRKEFQHFAAFSDPARREQIPDPNAPGTYEMSVPDAAEGDPNTTALYRVLLHSRARNIVPRLVGTTSLGAEALGTTGVLARWRLGDGAELVLATNFGSDMLPVGEVDGAMLFESRAGDAERVRGGQLPARTTVGFLLEAG